MEPLAKCRRSPVANAAEGCCRGARRATERYGEGVQRRLGAKGAAGCHETSATLH